MRLGAVPVTDGKYEAKSALLLVPIDDLPFAAKATQDI